MNVGSGQDLWVRLYDLFTAHRATPLVQLDFRSAGSG